MKNFLSKVKYLTTLVVVVSIFILPSAPAFAAYSEIERQLTGEIVESDSITGSFKIKQKDESGEYVELYSPTYEVQYTTQLFNLTPVNNEVVLRIVHEDNNESAGIEMLSLQACGEIISPIYARYVITGQDILDDLVADDLNVVTNHHEEIEIGWNLSGYCSSAILSMKANEYTSREEDHLRFPKRGYGNELYNFQNDRTIAIDGFLNEVDGLDEADFSTYWTNTTGHPEANAYFYFSHDNGFIYLSADIVSDNTNDYGLDWIELTLYDVSGDMNTFRVSDLDDTYGTCGFGVTTKAAHKHQTCEVKIPLPELEEEVLEFSIQYYGTLAESNPPLIDILSPADDSTNVAANSDLIITFDENVSASTTGNIVIYDAHDDSIFALIPSDDAQVTVSGDEVAINSDADFSASTTYYILIDAGAFGDQFDNPFAGISDPTTWNFTTDGTNPIIDSFYPEDSSVDIAIDLFNQDGAYIYFNEDIVAGAGNIVVHNASDDSVVATFDVTDTDYVTISDNEVTLYTEEIEINLERETTYYILIDAGAFEDLSGNPFAGISDPTTWSFATELNPTVLLDETFTAGDGFNNNVYALALQEDGKIVVGGSFNEYDGSTTGQDIARLNPDGTLDETFTTGDGFYSGGYGTVYALTLDADNKIIVGGNFTEYDNVYTGYAIARLNPDGTLDETFTTGDGFDGGQVYALALQPDGKIVVGGSFSQYDGDSVGNIARLNPDGTLDETFTVGDGFNDNVHALALQPDGKIVVGGSFNEYDGSTTGQDIARLNSDGTLDETLTTGTGFDTPETIYTLVIQDDGKIIAGGDFTAYDGDSVNNIARLNPDGTLDETFTTGDGFSSTVRSLALQEDGKIVVGGSFNEYDGSTTGQDIARLNPDGSLDETFLTNEGFFTVVDFTVYALALQDDRKIIVGGSFVSYNGDTTNSIARLIPPPEDVEEVSSGRSSSGTATRGRFFNNRAFTTAPLSDAELLNSLLKQLITLLNQLLEQLRLEQQNQ